MIVSYAAIYLIWGSTYFAIAMAVQSMPVSWLMAVRYILGGLVLTLVPLLAGQIKVSITWKHIASALFMGFFLLIIGNGLVSVAEKTLDSSLAAIMIACTPFLVAFMNTVFHRKPLSLFSLFGAILGVVGILILFVKPGTTELNLSPDMIIMLLAILGWSLGTSWGHKVTQYPQPLFSVGLQMLFAGVACTLYALIADAPPQEIFSLVQPEGWWSALYLTVFGSLGIVAYNYLLTKEPSFRITTHTLVNPLIAVLLGVFLGGEALTSNLLWALPIILLGLTLMLFGPRIFKKLPQKTLEKL